MRSNYLSGKNKIEKLCREEVRRFYDENSDALYEAVARDIIPQNTAVHCYVLAKCFGFGRRRLHRFVSMCDSINELMMQDDAFIGKPLSSSDVLCHVQEKYHLDLELSEVMVKERTAKP